MASSSRTSSPSVSVIRLCAVSRKHLPKAVMLRFVASPDGNVVVDIAQKLPGRGVWLSCDPVVVREAVKRRVFARQLDAKADLETLLAMISQGLRHAFLQQLGLARRQGVLVTGQDKVMTLVRAGQAGLLCIAQEASETQVKKLGVLGDASKAGALIVVRDIEQDMLAKAIGGENTVYLAAKMAILPSSLRLAAWRYCRFVQSDKKRGEQMPDERGRNAADDAIIPPWLLAMRNEA